MSITQGPGQAQGIKALRQGPEVCDLFRLSLHYAQAKKPMRVQKSRANLRGCGNLARGVHRLFGSRIVQKRATKSSTSGHCLKALLSA